MLQLLHGGGYCSGSIKSHRRMVTEAGRALGMRTLAIDYRRAPEHRFPAQHEDARTAWRFLRRQGIAAGHIAVGGDGAGGNLTFSLFLYLRGFPPMLIQVGSAETLSDATRLAEAAGTADVTVRLEVWPHRIHAWPVWNAAIEDGRRALASAGGFVRGRIG